MARSLNAHQIPSGWQYELLDKLAERCSGHTPSKSFPEYWNGGIKWISLADSHRLDKGYVYETDKEISTEGVKNSSANVHPAGTVVISRDAGIGKSGVMAEPMAISQHFIAWKCDNEQKMNNWYLYNWLQFNKQEFERQAVGSTIKTIGLPFFKKLKIAAPPYLEQQKIAKILSTWDKAISMTERLIDNSTQQKKALMQQLLTGKKRLLDDEGKRFAGEWEEVKLSKWLVEYKEKSTVQDQYDVYTSSRNGLVLQSVYFANSRIAGRDNIGFHVIPPNHITYRSRSDDGFFTFNLFSNDKNGLISNYYPVFSTKGSNEFFIALFEQYRATFGRYSVGTSQKVLSLNALKDILFKIPSIPEQRKIATVLTNTDKEIELLEQQLADLQQEKKALMQVLLTGKKRVKLND